MAPLKRKRHSFTLLNLPVSKRYLFQPSRRTMIMWGNGLALAFLAYVGYDALMQKSSFISSGTLSSNHANIEKECGSCHDFGNEVSAELCSNCHEKNSELTIYDFKAHYLYRSNDLSRLMPDKLSEYADREEPCHKCHTEHQGRNAPLTEVSDMECLTCHEFGSFNESHPEFEFARERTPDDSSLAMTHLRHVTFVLQQKNGIDNLDLLFKTIKAKTLDLAYFYEEACLYCHTPQPDGKNFSNINFDEHCAACHIKSDAIVQGLPKSEPGKAGVETIAQMQRRGGPGLAWTFAANPRLVVEEDGEVSKIAIIHKDPWILENLKQIRQRIYPVKGLFDLLDSFGELPAQSKDSLYVEATTKLQAYIDELHNHGELKGELSKVEQMLQRVRERLKLPGVRRTGALFNVPVDKMNRSLTESQMANLQQLAFDLTSPDGPECQQCHMVKNASIQRVRAEQNVLIRSEFNHRAHILERRCVQCHTAIPIMEKSLRFSVEKYSDFKQTKLFRVDKSGTQNIPGIEMCKECHSVDKVANNCTTCHKFHSNKEHRSNLGIYTAR